MLRRVGEVVAHMTSCCVLAVNWGGAASLAAGWMLWPAIDKDFKASLLGGGPKKEEEGAKK